MKRKVMFLFCLAMLAIANTGCLSFQQKDVHSENGVFRDQSRSFSIGIPIVFGAEFVGPSPVYRYYESPPVTYGYGYNYGGYGGRYGYNQYHQQSQPPQPSPMINRYQYCPPQNSSPSQSGPYHY
jgi:hypothetical protein